MYTHDCVARSSDNSIFMFADDIVTVGLTSNNNEAANLDEVEGLTLVPGEKPLPECLQDQGNDCGLQEESTTTTT